MDSNQLKSALNAIGALAEMSLVFYRAVIASGASAQEAKNVLDAYISATIYGRRQKGGTEE